MSGTGMCRYRSAGSSSLPHPRKANSNMPFSLGGTFFKFLICRFIFFSEPALTCSKSFLSVGRGGLKKGLAGFYQFLAFFRQCFHIIFCRPYLSAGYPIPPGNGENRPPKDKNNWGREGVAGQSYQIGGVSPAPVIGILNSPPNTRSCRVTALPSHGLTPKTMVGFG